MNSFWKFKQCKTFATDRMGGFLDHARGASHQTSLTCSLELHLSRLAYVTLTEEFLLEMVAREGPRSVTS